MAIKQDFAKQLESQIAVWQAQIAEHQERLKQASTQAKAEYDKGVTQLQASAEEATKLLAKVRESSEQAWADMQTASGKAFEQLQKGWADALKRFG
jgi:frataxin-like iron-binding protein CyaY